MTGEGTATGKATPREALELVHHHPGRLRARAEAFRTAGDPAVSRVRERLEAIPGVTRFQHNPRTGSVLVEYQPGLVEPDAVLAAMADSAGIDRFREGQGPRVRAPALIAIDAARELNAIAYELTGWRADLRSMVPASLAALAAYSFANHKDERLPRWDNLLYWSYNIFLSLHQREIRDVADAPVPPEPES